MRSPRSIQQVVIIGSGLMAPGIAAACAAAHAAVTITARNEERAATVARLGAATSAGAVTSAPISPEPFEEADLVIEAIVEDLTAKRELYTRVETWLRPTTILATNTSSLRLDALTEGLARPHQFVGFHFLNPAELTSIAEIVPASATSSETVERVTTFAEQMGKRPIVLRHEVPGFIWNRIQFAVLRECLHLLEAGVAEAEVIDSAVADGLAPRWMGAGPLATAQLGGLDTFRRVAEELFPALASESIVSQNLARDLYDWDKERRDAMIALRQDAIRTGARFSYYRP